MKIQIKTAYFFIVAFTRNLLIEYHNTRLVNKKRKWTAHGTFGSGVVPLGKVNQSQAVAETARFGSVIYCDVENALVFYNEK